MWTPKDFENEVCLQPSDKQVAGGLTADEIARLVYRAIWFMEGERWGMARREMDRVLAGIGAEPYDDKYKGGE